MLDLLVAVTTQPHTQVMIEDLVNEELDDSNQNNRIKENETVLNDDEGEESIDIGISNSKRHPY